jgi:hypothetical protein
VSSLLFCKFVLLVAMDDICLGVKYLETGSDTEALVTQLALVRRLPSAPMWHRLSRVCSRKDAGLSRPAHNTLSGRMKLLFRWWDSGDEVTTGETLEGFRGSAFPPSRCRGGDLTAVDDLLDEVAAEDSLEHRPRRLQFVQDVRIEGRKTDQMKEDLLPPLEGPAVEGSVRHHLIAPVDSSHVLVVGKDTVGLLDGRVATVHHFS